MVNICSLFLLFTSLIYDTKCNIVTTYYPRYHLAPTHGWMNDPNGFCYYNNEFHLFFQYNPDSSQEPGIAHWAHAVSKDLFHWKHLPVAMYPDQWYDKTGVFSGSAVIENDTMYLFYTGNLNHPNETPDHEQHQALAWSIDGVNVTKYEANPIIQGTEHQPNIRDPKVWKHKDTYYMVLGNSFNNNTLGRVLLYASKNMVSWEQVSILSESDGFLGYMWECPDFFELNGKFVLLFSPQGVKAEGDKYRNLYQTGYIVGDFDYNTSNFTNQSMFYELDHGHDFYATQTILDQHNRRLLVAWFDMWEEVYPERNDGWTGQMTIVRELSLTNDNLIQKPVREIKNVGGTMMYSGRNVVGGKAIPLLDNTADIRIKARSSSDFKLHIESENQTATVTIAYDHTANTVTLDRGGNDGVRRTQWIPNWKLQWRIFVDASSIELFCGEGEVTFSSRFFPQGKVSVRVNETSTAEEMFVKSMQQTVPYPVGSQE